MGLKFTKSLGRSFIDFNIAQLELMRHESKRLSDDHIFCISMLTFSRIFFVTKNWALKQLLQ